MGLHQPIVVHIRVPKSPTRAQKKPMLKVDDGGTTNFGSEAYINPDVPYVRVCFDLHMHTRTHTHTHTHTRTRAHAHYTHTYTYTHTHTQIHTCTRHTYSQPNTYTHTHAHTQTRKYKPTHKQTPFTCY